jgi:hypothetical protein
MNDITQGINQILWFIHRTVFEHIPALLILGLISLYLNEFEPNTLPGILDNAVDYFKSSSQGFIKVILLFAILTLIHSIISAIGHFLFVFDDKDKINLEKYPYYVLFKDKINEDFEKSLKTKSGKFPGFDVEHIYSVTRYEIMQNKKEFNTFLWYDSTKNDIFRNFAISFFLITTFILPAMLVDSESFWFNVMEYSFFCGSALLFFCFVFYKIVNEKFSEINKQEETAFINKTNKLPYEFDNCDGKIVAFLLAGAILILISIDDGILESFVLNIGGNEFKFKLLLRLMGINLILIPVNYLFLIYEFRENKAFNRLLIDAYISMRYEKELFNLEKLVKEDNEKV